MEGKLKVHRNIKPHFRVSFLVFGQNHAFDVYLAVQRCHSFQIVASTTREMNRWRFRLDPTEIFSWTCNRFDGRIATMQSRSNAVEMEVKMKLDFCQIQRIPVWCCGRVISTYNRHSTMGNVILTPRLHLMLSRICGSNTKSDLYCSHSSERDPSSIR